MKPMFEKQIVRTIANPQSTRTNHGCICVFARKKGLIGKMGLL